METLTIVLLLVYLIGCVLSYGKIYGIICSIDYLDIDIRYPNDPIMGSDITKVIAITLSSWLGFLIGTIVYFVSTADRYFLKYNKNDLIELYYQERLKRH